MKGSLNYQGNQDLEKLVDVFLQNKRLLFSKSAKVNLPLHMHSICVVVRLAKYNIYRNIGCITDQSNWSGPFSLVVMMPD